MDKRLDNEMDKGWLVKNHSSITSFIQMAKGWLIKNLSTNHIAQFLKSQACTLCTAHK